MKAHDTHTKSFQDSEPQGLLQNIIPTCFIGSWTHYYLTLCPCVQQKYGCYYKVSL